MDLQNPLDALGDAGADNSGSDSDSEVNGFIRTLHKMSSCVISRFEWPVHLSNIGDALVGTDSHVDMRNNLFYLL